MNAKPKPVRAKRLSDGVAGWFMPTTEPTHGGYLPEGMFTATEGPDAGRSRIAWKDQLEFEEVPT